MSYLTDAVSKSLAALAAITDAQYPGDPSGTDAKAAYFTANVHNFIKDLAMVVQPSRQYMVSPAFSTVGSPFFANAALAYAAIKAAGSGSSNKAVMKISPKADSYADALVFDHNGYVIVKGEGSGTVISGSLIISTGVHIFDSIRFTGNIRHTGGVAVFKNCHKPGGDSTIEGSATVVIDDCDSWSTVDITGNDNKVFMDNVKNVLGAESIYIHTGLTGGTYVFRNLNLIGTLREETLATEKSNINESVTAKPTTY